MQAQVKDKTNAASVNILIEHRGLNTLEEIILDLNAG